ncbi:LOW QUALITY PROTEIN: cytosolic beta-glucosidase-like [Mergus octosetaceus]
MSFGWGVGYKGEVKGNGNLLCVLMLRTRWSPFTMTTLVLEDIAFPAGFAWGAATAAYQIEEGWNADGKGPNVWDTFTHQGGDRVFKNQTGDVACGSYTLWEEDLKCIKQLGLTHYRFSLSWSRLLPDGTTGFINQKGMESDRKQNSREEAVYPANQIQIIKDQPGYLAECDTKSITSTKSLITWQMASCSLYHFDLPQSLEDRGWRSEKIIETFDIHAEQITDPSWPLATGSLWLAVVPWGFHLLYYIKDTYNIPVIYITENGFSQSDPALLDDSQWEYFRLNLQEIL